MKILTNYLSTTCICDYQVQMHAILCGF